MTAVLHKLVSCPSRPMPGSQRPFLELACHISAVATAFALELILTSPTTNSAAILPPGSGATYSVGSTRLHWRESTMPTLSYSSRSRGSLSLVGFDLFDLLTQIPFPLAIGLGRMGARSRWRCTAAVLVCFSDALGWVVTRLASECRGNLPRTSHERITHQLRATVDCYVQLALS